MTNRDNIEEARKIILAGLTGTSFMTLFSYKVSSNYKENFKEPELLGRLLYRLKPDLGKEFTQFAGWNLHYLAGITFSFFYAKIWKDTNTKPTLTSGLVLGALSGVVGLAVWKL